MPLARARRAAVLAGSTSAGSDGQPVEGWDPPALAQGHGGVDMFHRIGRPQTRFHVPLVRVMLCIDCEECFELGAEECPACGSETWTPLVRFLESRAA